MNGLRKVARRAVSATVLLGLIGSLPLVQASDDRLYNVFSLNTAASAEVDNDLMVATLVVQEENADPALLASDINTSMRWALDIVRPFDTLNTRTHDYQTYPYYDTGENRKLIGWRGSQSIRIETDDFQTAAKAIQALQERLQVQSIQLAAKATTRSMAVDALIDDALNAFKKRASLIQNTMGATGYRIIEASVNSDQGSIGMYDPRSAKSVHMMRSAGIAEPAIDAGTSRVSVQVFGSIQLD